MVTKETIHPPPPPSTPERAPWEDIAQLSEGIAQLIKRFDRLIALVEAAAPALPGVPAVPEVEVTVRTDWVAKVPEQVYRHAIRAAGTFYTDRMVNWTKGKRITFKAESSLNQAVNLQVIGNIVDDRERATDIGPALPLAANSNLSVGPAWDDWNPFIGIRITAAVVPTAGVLTIWAVIQE